ncbi:carbohydrate porin [Ralstonia nicotianae]|uniref:Porin n=1 Tax=Ralstonia nicotianae TaxID=3037696 RepID=A0ABX8A0J5_9RALS|nr:carbohydrate porin [Ralstonia nicotianae]QIK21648.1 carbohydrate porin [Ralstonia solanacearum]QUP61258.1 porin [Ralstonia nicotianae]
MEAGEGGLMLFLPMLQDVRVAVRPRGRVRPQPCRRAALLSLHARGARAMPEPDHLACRAAGGSGAFLGDGALNHAYARALEWFYSMQPAKGILLSPDVRLIQNPGDNRDRGPAKSVGLRVRAAF